MIHHCVLLLYFFTSIVFAITKVSFDDPNIQYVGRWQPTLEDIQSGWPGAYFKVIFQQTRTVKLQLTRPANVLIQIDGGPTSFFANTTPTIDLVPLPDNGEHQVLVMATESIGVQSLVIEDTGTTVPPKLKDTHLVEFIGHDLTLGTDTSQGPFTSFSWLTSDMIQKDHALTAYHDATLIHGLSKKYFDMWLQQQQDRVTKPDAIVLLLGANDKRKGYSSADYREELTTFLIRIRQTSLAPEAPIFVLSEPLGDMFRSSQHSVLELNHQGDQQIYFIDTTGWLKYGPTLYYDKKRLNDLGHEQFAKRLAPLLLSKLNNPHQPLPGPAPNPSLPGDWQTMDVGDETQIGLPGTVSADSSSTFTLWGSGADIDSVNDAFRFMYQPFSGTGTLESTIRSHSTFAKCAKAGIMIREHLGSGSPLIMLGISPADGVFVQVRHHNFESTKIIKKMKASPPYRLRLARQSNHLFEAQIQHIDILGASTAWEPFASIPFSLSKDVYAGLAVTSCDTSVVSVAKFTEVTLYHTSTLRFVRQQN
ncbi:hypothetical protein CU098_006235 [Rhizopus stolonifer]|uniref:SGNH hydrolase-type esterase domain-containing protein n=1 Tax=Rhizopus stolonifer TaxID=4846 RepID=A0A367JAH6_RHIST|nr:hypothetical protein CU098_006235 [Rhizopus stolonifer]